MEHRESGPRNVAWQSLDRCLEEPRPLLDRAATVREWLDLPRISVCYEAVEMLATFIFDSLSSD